MPNSKIYRAIGLMSGTSLDGVDAAIIQTDGQDIVRFGEAVSLDYSALERGALVRATQQALKWQFAGPPPASFAQAEAVIHQTHTAAIKAVLNKSGLDLGSIDVIGLHGQTVLHRGASAAQKGKTLQLGDGEKLAQTLGVDVVYDFRSADVAAGGQGAPLAPIYHKALMIVSCLPANAAVLNIGGVSNFTCVGPGGELIASDAGPGNGPLDQWVKLKGYGDYDKDGALSGAGTPDFSRLEGWLKRSFFSAPVPRSADRYDFDVLPSMHGLSPANGAATLCAFCALGVARTLVETRADISQIIVCGGGRKNPAIMAALAEATGAKIIDADRLGWDGDALEAQAFGYLAVRTLKNLPLSFPKTTGVKNPVVGGVIAAAAL